MTQETKISIRVSYLIESELLKIKLQSSVTYEHNLKILSKILAN